MRPRSLLFALAVAALACGHVTMSPELKAVGSAELGCPSDQLTVTRGTGDREGAYFVDGCNKTGTYLCWRSYDQQRHLNNACGTPPKTARDAVEVEAMEQLECAKTALEIEQVEAPHLPGGGMDDPRQGRFVVKGCGEEGTFDCRTSARRWPTCHKIATPTS